MPRYFRDGTIDRKGYAEQLDKSIDLMWLRSKEEVSRLAPFFNQQSITEGDTWKIDSVGQALPLPVRNEDTEKKPFAQPAKGFPKTITVYPYRLFVRVTANMMLTQRFGRVNGMVSGLPMAAVAKLEALRAVVFNSQAFSGTAGSDSLSLCNDSHPHLNPEYGTWDNLGTGPMTVSNVHALRLLGQNMTNEFGRPYMVTITDLMFSTALERKAEEIRIAKKDPETALNTPHVLINDLAYTVVPRLTSTTAYFGFGQLRDEEKGIYEVTRLAPTVDNDEPANVDIPFQKRVKFLVGFGYATSQNVYGSAGT